MFGKLVAHQPPPSYCQTVQYMVMVERELAICLLCVSNFPIGVEYLCNGASLYAPCSLLISNKFWIGSGGGRRWGVGGGEVRGLGWRRRKKRVEALLRIRIRIHMFLGLLDPDPDPSVRCSVADP
jgi:hypothetical protein